LLPLGAVLATPVAALPPSIVAGFFAFGLIALLYLVTEELLVEAHQTPDRPWVTAMFFVGFLAILVLEELMS
ncbi:transporter, partial [Escherichia coli]|nr:transporter [Escherichia coli]